MPHTELQGWFEYFRIRPPGWRDDQRTSMMMNAFGVKSSGDKLFPSLKALKEHSEKKKQETGFAMQFLQRFGKHFPELRIVDD